MRKKSLVFALAATFAFCFSSGVYAGGMDEHEGDSMMKAHYVKSGNKELVLRSGYYYQKASQKDSSGKEDYTEHGFSIGFGLSRIIAEHELFGVNFRSSFRFEPDMMIGFVDASDHTLHHLLAPAFLQVDFPLPGLPMETAVGLGSGLMVYDIGNLLDRQNYLPVIGKIAFDYIKRDGLKMGVEGRGHYVVNQPQGSVDTLWGASATARISFLF